MPIQTFRFDAPVWGKYTLQTTHLKDQLYNTDLWGLWRNKPNKGLDWLDWSMQGILCMPIRDSTTCWYNLSFMVRIQLTSHTPHIFYYLLTWERVLRPNWAKWVDPNKVEFLEGRMWIKTASPPPKMVTSFQVMLHASIAHEPLTKARLNSRESRRSIGTERSRGDSIVIRKSFKIGVVLKGRQVPRDLFQYAAATVMELCKRFRLALGLPSPVITSGRIFAQEEMALKHCRLKKSEVSKEKEWDEH